MFGDINSLPIQGVARDGIILMKGGLPNVQLATNFWLNRTALSVQTNYSALSKSTTEFFVQGLSEMKIDDGESLKFESQITASPEHMIQVEGVYRGVYTKVLGRPEIAMSHVRLNASIDPKTGYPRHAVVKGLALFGTNCFVSDIVYRVFSDKNYRAFDFAGM